MTAIELTNIPQGQEFNPVLRRQFAASCSILEGLGVHYAFRGHLVDTETGEHGIRGFIRRVFTEAGAILPRHKGELTGEIRRAYVAKSLTADQIDNAVRGVVPANSRYPFQTLRQYLSERLYYAGVLGKFPMTKTEQKLNDVAGKRPNWYYLIKSNQED